MAHHQVPLFAAGLSLLFLSGITYGEGGVPPSFPYGAARAVAIDIETVNIVYEFDVTKSEARATATMVFKPLESGFPIFDLVPNPTALNLDGDALQPELLKLQSDPDRVTKFRILEHALALDETHTLTMSYKLDAQDVTFSNGNVRVGFFMSDLTNGGRDYFEQYGPANLEFDQVSYHFQVRLLGTTVEHEIFTNATLAASGEQEWDLKFSSYFTSSSPFFHMAEKGRFKVGSFTFSGAKKDIPVTVYGATNSLVQEGMTKVREILSENEKTFGPTAHERFVIYLTSGGGGMEYCGATMTSLWALGHELTHSWYARGVMPSDGNAGWMDEAIASWRDNGYPRASSAPSGAGTNLGGFSPYRRHTTTEAYDRGATLISQFDFIFRDLGGMRGVLAKLFQSQQRTTITVAKFKSFLEAEIGHDLTPLFERYVFGRNSTDAYTIQVPERVVPLGASRHPRPFTKEERAALR